MISERQSDANVWSLICAGLGQEQGWLINVGTSIPVAVLN